MKKRLAVLLGSFLAIAGVCPDDAAALPEPDAPAVAPGVFDDFDDAKEYPSAESLGTLLIATPGERCEIAEARKWDKPIRRVSGLFRLNTSWPASSSLRLSILDPQQFQVHLWNGAQGVTLRYYPDYHQTWGAYGTTREADRPRPADYALWATSEDYYRRSGLGTVEIHVHAGRLFLVRGDLTLLSVPMETVPSEVYLEGAGLVRGVAFVASKWTPESAAVRPAIFKSDRPAELAWDLGKPVGGTLLNRLSDGRVELAADEKPQPHQALVSTGELGVGEYIFEVEDADVGTGVCLADAEGKPILRAGFFRHRETGKKVFDILPPWAGDLERNYDVNKQPVPYAGKRQWLRVISGAGVFKLFTSGDGVSWRQSTVHSPGFEGKCVQVGLYCLPAPQKRSIKLRSIASRRLDSFYAMVPEAVLSRVPPIPRKVDKPEEWQVWMVESRPPDVAAAAWWRACVLRTLGAGVRPQLAQPILTRLQQAVLEESPGLDLDRLMQFMADSVLLYASEDWASMDRLLPEVRRLGGALVCRGQSAPFSLMSRAMLRWSFWHPRRLPVFSDELLRHELFLLAGQEREEPIRSLCRQVRYWASTGGPRQWDEPVSAHAEYLTQWANPVLAPAAGKPRRGRRPLRPPSYQATHPLVEQISKEGFNTIAEIRAAVDGQAWREACQIIVSAPNATLPGLVPDGDDPRLLVSFARAAAAEMRQSPEMAKTMLDQFGKIGQLRLNQAIAAGDDPAVEAVVSQFPDTPVATRARQWLGDRRLASGRFLEAAGYYRRAVVALPEEQRESLLARYRLAGALLGEDWGRPLRAAVQFGATPYTAAEFEQMAAGLRQSPGEPAAASTATTEAFHAASRGFAPGRYELRSWAKHEGSHLKRPGILPDKGVDWVGRQSAVLATSRQLIVNTQAELAAFDLDTGKPRWSQAVEAGEQYQRWPLAPMRPVAFGQRILARRLTKDGVELACLDAADGRVLWTSQPDDYVASDAVVVDGKPMALCCVSQEGAGRISLLLAEFHSATGRVRSRVPLADFRDSLRRPLHCQMLVAEDRLLASVAGCVLAFAPTGRLHWIRRQIYIPPAGPDYQNSQPWFAQLHDPLHVSPGRVYATQPGVWGMECLDLDSGRLLWRQAAGSLARVAGKVDDRMILETADGPVALDAQTGKVAWMRYVRQCQATRVCGNPRSVVCLGTQTNRSKGKETSEGITLSWYNPQDGRPMGQCSVEARGQPGCLLGPLAAAENRQWIALANPQQPAQREWLEAVRTGEVD